MEVEVTFQAQEWYDDQARPAERDPNRVKFTIPLEEAIPDSEEVPDDPETAIDLLPADYSMESDVLAEHANAPDWVNEWVVEAKGPFYVQTELV